MPNDGDLLLEILARAEVELGAAHRDMELRGQELARAEKRRDEVKQAYELFVAAPSLGEGGDDGSQQ